MTDIEWELLENDNNGAMAARSIGLRLQAMETAPSNMSLEIYPDPRYLRIASSIPRRMLRAACRVAGTHVHVGVPSIETALALSNSLREQMSDLIDMGDGSQGKRIALYKKMARNWDPPHYDSPEHYFEVASSQGFAANPRDCWHLIRINPKGTVECRMFGATPFVDETLYWVECVLDTARKETGYDIGN